jgi:hypothetical protein
MPEEMEQAHKARARKQDAASEADPTRVWAAAAVVVSAEVTGGIHPPPGRPNQWTRLVSWRC